jgi:hypothetical protein
MTTRPLVCSGPILNVNYATSAAGGIRCEVQDASGKPIAGLSLNDSIELFGDETAGIIRWRNGADLSALAGRQIRLRFVMRDADLYSLRFRGR